MTHYKLLVKKAIETCKKELKSLNDFAENEGHTNRYVMLAVANRINELKNIIEQLSGEKARQNHLKSLEEHGITEEEDDAMSQIMTDVDYWD